MVYPVNSHAIVRRMRRLELRKFSCKLSLVNLHEPSCNACSRFDRSLNIHKISMLSTLACQLKSQLDQKIKINNFVLHINAAKSFWSE